MPDMILGKAKSLPRFFYLKAQAFAECHDKVLHVCDDSLSRKAASVTEFVRREL